MRNPQTNLETRKVKVLISLIKISVVSYDISKFTLILFSKKIVLSVSLYNDILIINFIAK